MYNKMGKPLPEGWALDETGFPSQAAPRVLANIVGKKGGGIVPLGGPFSLYAGPLYGSRSTL
jgi:LDH2 family malate/lactate/ureidoglycolate dehydrogenase